MNSAAAQMRRSGADEIAFKGRLMDLDAHEMIPSGLWVETFGDAARIARQVEERSQRFSAENTITRDEIISDALEITHDTVWNVKGVEAPGAIDMGRRAAVMDEMGVARQLVFPGFGLIGLRFIHDPLAWRVFGFTPGEFDQQQAGRDMVAAHNAWAGRIAGGATGARVRCVGIIDTASDVDRLVADARDLLKAGIRAVWIPGSIPPCGTSPGDMALDPFWAILAEANVAVTLHIGTEFGLLASSDWAKGVPQFTPASGSSLEFPIEPFRASTLHLTCNNFLSAMVLGGVFERHPTLRFGVIECAAHWVGPLADQLDLWYEEFHRRLHPVLPMKPSEYINRNVRVTPFHFEPVDTYFEAHPNLRNVYSYSTDYPHREGGKHSAQSFADRIERLGPDIAENFFVSNGEWLLPD